MCTLKLFEIISLDEIQEFLYIHSISNEDELIKFIQKLIEESEDDNKNDSNGDTEGSSSGLVLNLVCKIKIILRQQENKEKSSEDDYEELSRDLLRHVKTFSLTKKNNLLKYIISFLLAVIFFGGLEYFDEKDELMKTMKNLKELNEQSEDDAKKTVDKEIKEMEKKKLYEKLS